MVQPPTEEHNRRTQPSDRRSTPAAYSLRPSTAAATREIPYITSAPLPASSWGPWGGNLRLYSPHQQRMRRVVSARSAPSTPRSAQPTQPPLTLPKTLPPPVPPLALGEVPVAPPEPRAPSSVEIHTVHSIPTTPTATPHTTPFTNAAPLTERSDSASPRPPSAHAPSARVRALPCVTPRSPRPSPRAPLPLGHTFAEAAAAAAAAAPSGADEVRAACSHRDACDVVPLLGMAEDVYLLCLYQMRMPWWMLSWSSPENAPSRLR